ncbi:hypothetical protein DW233_07960 [Collinsella sp. AM20-15AC]|nr:hypothetical protein DW233_07960 [Collinsella sp. AM20-15AC]
MTARPRTRATLIRFPRKRSKPQRATPRTRLPRRPNPIRVLALRRRAISPNRRRARIRSLNLRRRTRARPGAKRNSPKTTTRAVLTTRSRSKMTPKR